MPWLTSIARASLARASTTYPQGVNGAASGARKVMRRADCTTEVVGNKREDMTVEAGDALDFITLGSGGWGDPLERDPEPVAKEVRQASSRSPVRAYGVVIADRAVDATATEALRAEMRSTRGDTIPLFNYGPGIEELRANAKAETGLDASKPPIRRAPVRAPDLAVAAE